MLVETICAQSMACRVAIDHASSGGRSMLAVALILAFRLSPALRIVRPSTQMRVSKMQKKNVWKAFFISTTTISMLIVLSFTTKSLFAVFVWADSLDFEFSLTIFRSLPRFNAQQTRQADGRTLRLSTAVPPIALCAHILAGALAESLAQAAARLVQFNGRSLRQTLQVAAASEYSDFELLFAETTRR